MRPSTTPGRFTRALAAFTGEADERGQPLTINLSESFAPDSWGSRPC